MKIERHQTGTKDKWIIEPITSNDHIFVELVMKGLKAFNEEQKCKREEQARKFKETIVTIETS